MFQLDKKHQKYEKYNPTNIDWIGDIPNGWEVWKLKRLGNIETGTTPPKAEEGNYMEDGIPWIKPDNLDGFVPLNDSKEKLSQMGASQARIIKKGSVLVCGIGTIGKIGVAGCDLTTNQQINSIIFNQKIDELFGQYLVFASRKEMEKQSNKVVVSILNKSQQSNIFYPVCSLQEQQKIATYLDEKTAILDEAIVKKKNQIELLAEHRTALINDAITKGLDKNVEMKDSGIEWIGMIPKGWEVKKLKYGLKKLTDGSHTSVEVLDHGLPYITVNNIDEKSESIDLHDCKRISQEDYDFLVRNGCKPKIGDILFSQIGTIGLAVEVKENDDFVMLSSLAILSPNKKQYHNRFLIFYLRSHSLSQQWKLLMAGGAVKRITLSHIRNFVSIFPSLKEQKEIADYLDKETKYIDDMIAKIEKSIELLEEYKNSLISHAVSGKIKI